MDKIGHCTLPTARHTKPLILADNGYYSTVLTSLSDITERNERTASTFGA
jgi:hypothetical protein